jgi:hypothetical protein
MLVGVRKDCIMRIRALLFIPALAAVALAIGVSSASAATLFTTNNHASTRVTIGATATATSEGNFDFVTSGGAVQNRCTHMTLHTRVTENTVARSTLEVYGSIIGVCEPSPFTTTFAPSWKLTVTGAGTSSGGTTRFASALDNVQFDLAGIPGVFTGNLTTGLTTTQATATTNGICVAAAGAGSITNDVLGVTVSINARFCLTTAPSSLWSLT